MELPEYLDKHFDARFKDIETELGSLRESLETETGSIRESLQSQVDSLRQSSQRQMDSLRDTVRQGNENNARLVEMIQQQVLSLDQRIEAMQKELTKTRRFFVATLMAGLGVTIAIMSLIFQVLK